MLSVPPDGQLIDLDRYILSVFARTPSRVILLLSAFAAQNCRIIVLRSAVHVASLEFSMYLTTFGAAIADKTPIIARTTIISTSENPLFSSIASHPSTQFYHTPFNAAIYLLLQTLFYKLQVKLKIIIDEAEAYDDNIEIIIKCKKRDEEILSLISRIKMKNDGG
jgi:hypothetical protein